MARIRITNVVSATHDAATLAGLRSLTHRTQMNEKSAASDGEPTTYDVIGFAVEGSAVFDDVQAYNQALAGASSNLVVVRRVEGGTTRTLTIKNVIFTAADGSAPNTDTQQMGEITARFRAVPGASDTPATMITDA